MLIRLLCCFLLFIFHISAEPTAPPLEWQALEGTFNNTSPEFQTPRLSEGLCKGIHIWKAENLENSHYVVTKPRKCSQGQAPLKICDIVPLIFAVTSKGTRLVSLDNDKQGQRHVTLVDPNGSFYYAAIHSNNETVIALITQSTQQDPPEHQKFIESFTFLK